LKEGVEEDFRIEDEEEGFVVVVVEGTSSSRSSKVMVRTAWDIAEVEKRERRPIERAGLVCDDDNNDGDEPRVQWVWLLGHGHWRDDLEARSPVLTIA